MFLPWAVKRWVLRRFWGYQIADSARIGLSYVFPGQLVMGEGAYIGHLNVAIHLGRLECGAHSIIDRSNWITGHPPAAPTSRTARSAIRRCCSARMRPSPSRTSSTAPTRSRSAPSRTIAGYHSQLITHGINVVEGRQDCKPIRIGAYCLVGTRVTVLGGAALPDRSVLGAGSVLNKVHTEEYAVYAGQPAAKVKALDPEGAYFHRASGFVH